MIGERLLIAREFMAAALVEEKRQGAWQEGPLISRVEGEEGEMQMLSDALLTALA